MNLAKLKEEQIRLAKKVVTKDDFEQIKLVGGCDQAFKDNKVISTFIVMDYETLDILEEKSATVECRFPYIPGYLSYREAPAVVEAFSKLEKRPDLLMIDANGILHPRRIGMASHIGILLDIPTIGVAKTLLAGEIREDTIYMEQEARAMQLKTRGYSNPIYISPGHRISLRTSVEVVKKCLREPHKLPEPLHLAHRRAKKLK